MLGALPSKLTIELGLLWNHVIICRYVYPFIGCERPVISKPKISVVSREEIPLLGSPVSFTFMCSEVSLKDQLQCTPLSLEVWVPSEGVDNLAGTAKVYTMIFCGIYCGVSGLFLKVPLSEVFKSTSTIVDHCVYYKCSMKVPVLPCNLLSQQSCALINCSLSLMDQGPSSADAAKHEYGKIMSIDIAHYAFLLC